MATLLIRSCGALPYRTSGFPTDSSLYNWRDCVFRSCSDAEPRLTPQEPQQREYHDRNHDARDDREVKVESVPDYMDVARQPAEREAREPAPTEAGKDAQHANNDEETVHGVQSLTVADGVIIGSLRRTGQRLLGSVHAARIFVSGRHDGLSTTLVCRQLPEASIRNRPISAVRLLVCSTAGFRF
jgi:hypothetical protein